MRVQKPGAPLSLEVLLTHPHGFGLTTATPLQRAICRVIDGAPLGALARSPAVLAAFGGTLEVPRPCRELVLVAGIRGGKSLLAAACAVAASQRCDVSRLGSGEVPRFSIVSTRTDQAQVVYDHLRGRCEASPALRPLLMDVGSDTLTLRHPTGRPVEVKVVAGARAGSTLVGRWSAGVVFDEAPRMVGSDDGVVNLDDARHSIIGRILPGAQLLMIGSPWAPLGPVYRMVSEHWGRSKGGLFVVRATGPQMNPVYWTPQKVAEVKEHDPVAYRTDVLAEFMDAETGMFGLDVLEDATRDGPIEVPPVEGRTYVAAMDPATRGNAWTLVVACCTRGAADHNGRRVEVSLARQWVGARGEPLSPDAVMGQIAKTVGPYRVRSVWSDQYSIDALRDLARNHGISLQEDATTAARKLELFEGLRVIIEGRRLSLPPDPVLRADLLSVRKRVTATGFSVHLPKTSDGRHCDYAPALALALALPMLPPVSPESRAVFGDEHEAALAAAIEGTGDTLADMAAERWN